MRSSCAVLLFSAILLWRPGAALADGCNQRVAPPVLSVQTDVQAPKLDVHRGIKELTGDPHVAVPRGLEDFRFAVGATAALPSIQRRWELHGEPMSNGRVCWRVTKMRVFVSVATTVYIAREIPRDSCLWREVAKHEAKHVRRDRELFPQLPGIVRPKVARVIAQSFAAGTQEEANAILKARLSAAVNEAAAAFEETRNREQLKIDTREEYSHPNQVCGNAEVAAAIARAGLK